MLAAVKQIYENFHPDLLIMEATAASSGILNASFTMKPRDAAIAASLTLVRLACLP